jgi:hypothetical protein
MTSFAFRGRFMDVQRARYFSLRPFKALDAPSIGYYLSAASGGGRSSKHAGVS